MWVYGVIGQMRNGEDNEKGPESCDSRPFGW